MNSELIEEKITPVLDFKFDVAEDLDMQRPSQRHQLFAAAAAGNLSPIPSDNENGELATGTNSMSEPYDHEDLPEDADITAEQPPHWDYELDGDEDDDDDDLSLSRHRSYVDSNDSLESFEKLSAKFSEDSNGLSRELKHQQEIYEDSIGRSSATSTPALPTTITTPATPTSPTAPVSLMKLPEKTSEKAPEKPRGGARIVVPKTKAPKPTTNGSSAKPPLYRTKPAKSRLPKMEHIQSTIPKPRPRSTSTEVDKKAAATKAIRENKSSINRKKNLVIQQSRDLEEEAKETDYLTPLQKKNNYIKDLEQKLKDTRAKLENAERDVANADIIIQDKVRDIVARNNDEIEALKEQIREMEIVSEDLQKSYQDALSTIRAYEDTVEEMKNAMDQKQIDTNEMYLVMYRKGQESALFDREVQLEELASSAPQSVDVKELLAKLEKTQGELTKWQSIQMSSSYDGGEKPDTEALSKLRFLRDSMFHYLSDESRDQPQHLKAMIAILGFTEVQMKKIRKAVVDHHK